jgi:hypothetical protein
MWKETVPDPVCGLDPVSGLSALSRLNKLWWCFTGCLDVAGDFQGLHRKMHMLIRKLLFSAVAFVGMIAIEPSTGAANIVLNGNFGTGDYTGWTLSGDSSSDYVTTGKLSGSSYQAALTTNASDNGYLTQTLAITAGQQYQLSFLLAGDGATPNSFSASLGGTALDNLSNIGDTLPAGTSYSYTYTATASSTALQFTDDDAPGYLYLSNVSVTPTAVPEPASIMAIGIPAAMALLRRRRLQV